MRILFIDIDTLRPDHMGCYGYDRNTTPHLDTVAEEGIIFDNYYTSDAPCLPSRAALMSGVFGFRNGVVGHGGTAADRRLTGAMRDFRDEQDAACFHNIFRNKGIHTASISTFAERHSAWWFNAGLNEAYNIGSGGQETADQVLPVALDWLSRNGEKENWYLHVHVWDPHTLYRVPQSFGEPFKDESGPKWITQEVVDRMNQCVGPHCPKDAAGLDDIIEGHPRQPGCCDTLEKVKKMIDGYDTGIRYADEAMGEIFEKLRELNVYEDTAIIITADHGENMGELGIYAEHGTADQATCKIPMIIKWPGMQKGIKDRELHYSLDLLPTIADLLEVQKFSRWDGKSYASTLRTGEPCGREALVISQNAHICQRSARFGKWLYIRSIHDGFHLFPKEMLFDLEQDPYEQTNLANERQEIGARGAKIILDWQEEQMLKDPTNKDPMWTVMSEGGPQHAKINQLIPYLDRLEQTGRGKQARLLREKYLDVE